MSHATHTSSAASADVHLYELNGEMMTTDVRQELRKTAVDLTVEANLGTPMIEMVRNSHSKKDLVYAIKRVLASGIQVTAVRNNIGEHLKKVEAEYPL